jgi:hypothetical protein
MFLSGTDFWWYLDKAYGSVPGSGGSIALDAIPCVHGLTGRKRGSEVDEVKQIDDLTYVSL